MRKSKTAIPYSRQSITDSDIREVAEVLENDFITQGRKVEEFESALAAYCGSRYAVAVSSGTAALHLSCLAAGITGGDEAITSALTFAASANCVLYCGAKPVFADIQEDTANIAPEEIRRKLTRKTKVILPVHFAGHPCDLKEIRAIAKDNKLLVIEDACHALGAGYKGAKIGSCEYSDMTVFSFHPVKSITTGEGGAVLTNNKALYERVLLLRNHGITKDRAKLLRKREGAWYCEMQALGYNYRITDFQSALGVSQLKKLETFLSKRRALAARYREAFAGNDRLSVPVERPYVRSAWHLFWIKLRDARKRRATFEALRARGIAAQVHYIPVYLHPYYRRMGYRAGSCPKGEAHYTASMSIPLFPGLTLKQAKFVTDSVNAIVSR